MIRLLPVTREDLPQIEEWIRQDEWHRDDPKFIAEEMLTPNGLLSFCLDDEKGPVCFIRLNSDGDRVRLVIQFAPESEVSKRRLITGLIRGGIPAMKSFAKQKGYKGLVFESVNPSLILFGIRQGFTLDKGNDYVLQFNLENSN
jgi:hypothetical protein